VADDLPPLNPFPFQATTAVEEGPFVASYRAWASNTPTVLVEPVRRLTALARRYRDSFELDERGDGQAAFVYGPHGSGKTHAVRAAVGAAATEDDPPVLLPLYVKLSSPNVGNAYRRLMAQLSIADLTELALRFLGSLAGGASARPPLAGSVEEQLREDPSALLTMFSEHVLERGLLLQAQADRVRAVVADEVDFQRALTYLLEPDLSDAAYRWLQGRALSAAQLRRLGLSGQLDTPDQCQYGLQLLTLICARAGRPLVLVLDQAEKFLAQPDGTLVADSMGFLHSLVEKVPEQGGMLVVAANDETWSMLPIDLRQRFGTNDVACPALPSDDAFELLGVYILAAYGDRPPAGYQAPQPFTETAVRKLLRNSGGNMRALLQLAWHSFDRLAPGQHAIDAGQVPDEAVRYDPVLVQASVGRALSRLGSLTAVPRPGFHYGVALGAAGRLLVRVSEAMFYLDEATRAAEDVRVRSEVSGDELGRLLDRHVLIVIGYASPPVLGLLREAYDDVLVYRDDDSLAAQLAQVVDPAGVLTTRSTEAGAQEAISTFDRLADVGWSRMSLAAGLGDDIRAVAGRNEAERAVDRYEELSRRWPAERDRLIERIGAARRDREQADLDELDRVAAVYHGRRWLRANLAGAGVLLSFTAAAVLARLLATDAASPQLDLSLGGLAVALVAVAAGVSAGLWRLRPPRPATLSEAGRIARERFRERGGAAGAVEAPGPSLPGAAGPADLRSPDPYRRYGSLLVGLRGETPLQLRQALRTERVPLIRRALAGRLGGVLARNDLALPPDLLVDTEPAELPYLLESYRSPYWGEVVGLPAPARVLVLLMNGYGEDIRPGRRPPRRHDPGEASGGLSGHVFPPVQDDSRPDDEADPAVRLVVAAAAGDGAPGEAYTKGLTLDRLLRALDDAGDRDLRRTAELLSPFGGLGACDHLSLAAEVERLHLFVEQLLYFRDGGISPPATARPTLRE
jgi:hypothetical protein